MRLPSNIVLARIFFVIAAGLLVLVFTHKREAPAQQPVVAAASEEGTVTKYIAEVERKNELERDEIEQTRKLAKLAQAKKDSVECKFWTQQKASSSKPNPKTDEKIAHFCEMEATVAPI